MLHTPLHHSPKTWKRRWAKQNVPRADWNKSDGNMHSTGTLPGNFSCMKHRACVCGTYFANCSFGKLKLVGNELFFTRPFMLPVKLVRASALIIVICADTNPGEQKRGS